MCYEISCHRFLFDYSQKHHNTDACIAVSQINAAISTIEKALTFEIRIDMTRDALSSVINRTGNLELEPDNRHIRFKEDFFREEPDEIFEADFPSGLREKYISLLETV